MMKDKIIIVLVVIALIISIVAIAGTFHGYGKGKRDKGYGDMTQKEYGDMARKEKGMMSRMEREEMVRLEIEDFVRRSIVSFENLNSPEDFIALVNDSGGIFRNDLTYLFISDVTADIEAANAGFPEIAGTPLIGMLDSRGVDLGQIIVDGATPLGAWVTYRWFNADNKDVEIEKYAFVVRRDNLIFGAGYDDSELLPEEGRGYRAIMKRGDDDYGGY